MPHTSCLQIVGHEQNVKELFYTMLPDVRTSVDVGSRRPLVLPVTAICTWKWVDSVGGMVMTGDNRSTGKKTCHSATMCTTNIMRTGIETGPLQWESEVHFSPRSRHATLLLGRPNFKAVSGNSGPFFRRAVLSTWMRPVSVMQRNVNIIEDGIYSYHCASELVAVLTRSVCAVDRYSSIPPAVHTQFVGSVCDLWYTKHWFFQIKHWAYNYWNLHAGIVLDFDTVQSEDMLTLSLGLKRCGPSHI